MVVIKSQLSAPGLALLDDEEHFSGLAFPAEKNSNDFFLTSKYLTHHS
jgi:hypothetical protein